jgi:hypothetical protein
MRRISGILAILISLLVLTLRPATGVSIDQETGSIESRDHALVQADADQETPGPIASYKPIRRLKRVAKKLSKAAKSTARRMATFAASNARSMSTLSAALLTRLNQAGNAGPVTMTDMEYCSGCQLLVSMGLEHVDQFTDVETAMFVLHSACFEQPSIVAEVCDAMLKLDVQIASQMLVTRNAPLTCLAAGLCYTGQDT